MSNDFLKAADDARRLLRGFKAFEEVAAALEAAGIAEQSKTEALKDVESLRVQIASEKAELAAAKKDAAEARAKAKELIEQAELKAAALLEHTQQKAIAAAEKVRGEADAYLAAKTAEVDAVVNQQRKAEARVGSLSVEVKELEARVEKARAYLAKLAG